MEIVQPLIDDGLPSLAKLVAQILINKVDNPEESPLLEIAYPEQYQQKLELTRQADTVRILIYSDFASPSELLRTYQRMCKEDSRWNDILLVDEEPADYYVVINCSNNEQIPPLHKTIFFYTNPTLGIHPYRFGIWSDPPRDKLKFCASPDVHFSHLEWKLSLTYTQLLNLEIHKDILLNSAISTIIPPEQTSENAKLVKFIKFLEQNTVNIHTFGENTHDLSKYMGRVENTTDHVYIPYRYCIVSEPHTMPKYMTSNLVDGLLSECVVFYHGASDYREYIDSNSVICIDLANFESDYQKIKYVVENDMYNVIQQNIKNAKHKLLSELTFLPRLENILKTK